MLENDSGRRSGRERLASFLGMGPGRGDALRPFAYLGSGAMVALALGCGLLIERFIGLQSILLVFLMAVIGAAIAWGLFPSLFACVLSVLAFNFSLVPPLYTLTIADPENARRAVRLFRRRADRQQSDGRAAQPDRHCAVARQDDRGAVCLQPPACRHRHARRVAAGDHLPDLAMLDVATVLLLPPPQDGAGSSWRSARTRPNTGSMPADLRAARDCWEHGLPADEAPERRGAISGCFCGCAPMPARSASIGVARAPASPR